MAAQVGKPPNYQILMLGLFWIFVATLNLRKYHPHYPTSPLGRLDDPLSCSLHHLRLLAAPWSTTTGSW